MSFQSALAGRGVEIITSQYLPTQREVGRHQVRFPRSKKKRIRKKWAKNLRNWKIDYVSCVNDVYMVNGKFMIHPAGLENLKLYIAMQATKKIAEAGGLSIGGLY